MWGVRERVDLVTQEGKRGPTHENISRKLLGEGFRGWENVVFLAENEGRSLTGFLVETF